MQQRETADATQMNMKRMRGRNPRHPGGGGSGGGGGGGNYRPQNTGGQQPMNRNHVFDSIGPDLRIRGTAQQLFEKYLQLGRDATGAGDRVMAESYFQHAEHYFRILNAMSQAQQSPPPQHQGQNPNQNPNQNQQRRYHNGPETQESYADPGEQPEMSAMANGHAHEPDPDGDHPPPDYRDPA